MAIKMATHCKKCNVELSEFNSSYKGTVRDNRCKPCIAEDAREWRRNHKQDAKIHARRAHLKAAFNLTEEEYNDLLRRQGGVCAICHQENNLEGRELVVDHDHDNDKIRGLLCQACNTTLGLVKENVVILYSMIEYIHRHESKPKLPNITIITGLKKPETA